MYLVDCFGIIYKIDTDHGNAEIVSFDIDPDLVEIGYTINYNSKSYLITRIRNESQLKSEIKSISFVDDSSVIVLRKHAFNQSPIRSLTFPANFQYFEKGWCEEANYLVDIKISPYNKRYKCVDKMILGKSNPSSDIYDVLIFACRDITDVIIPPSVKYIDYSCFDGCTKIKNFIIPENSELQSIFKCAFANSSIKKLTIPSKFKNFGKGWCIDATELNEITVSKENPNFIVDENHLVLGKSNADSEVFDIVCFAPRNIKKARISSDVKYLNSDAFEKCIQIESIEFDENSKLVSIGSFCFLESSLTKISIPPSVQIIKKSAFSCSKIKEIDFGKNSKITCIEERAFEETQITKILFPASLKSIGDDSFGWFLKSIEFEKDSKLKSIGCNSFECCEITQISFPPTIELIDRGAFSDCSDLALAEIPDVGHEKKITLYDNTFEGVSDNFVLFVSSDINVEILKSDNNHDYNETKEGSRVHFQHSIK